MTRISSSTPVKEYVVPTRVGEARKKGGLTYEELNKKFLALESKPTPVILSPDETAEVESLITEANTALDDLDKKIKDLQAEYASEPEKAKKESAPLIEERNLLRLQLIGLKYRSGLGRPYNSVECSKLNKNLHRLARVYKRDEKQSPYEAQRKELDFTAHQNKQLSTLAHQYPEFGEMLIELNKGLLEKTDEELKSATWSDKFSVDLLKWILAFGCDVRSLVEYPNEAYGMHKSVIASHAGMVEKDQGIKIIETEKDGKKYRELAIKIQEEFIPVTDKTRTVQLNNPANPDQTPLTYSLARIYKEFQIQKDDYAFCSYFPKVGVVMHRAQIIGHNTHMPKGVLDTLDLKNKNWITQLPVAQYVTRQELEEMYPGQALPDRGGSAYANSVTREKKNMNVFGNHAYTVIIRSIIDEKGEEKFALYPFGLQTVDLPQGCADSLESFAGMPKGGIHYPDASWYLFHRFRHGEVIVTTPEEMQNLLDELAVQIQSSYDGKLPFMSQAHNCAYMQQRMHHAAKGRKSIDNIRHVAYEMITNDAERKNIRDKLENALYYYDDSALGDVIEHVLDKAITKEHLNKQGINLFKGSMELFKETLFKDNPEGIEALNKLIGQLEVASVAFDAGNQAHQECLKHVRDALKDLLKLSVHSQQLYKLHTLDGKFDNWFLSGMITFISWMPFEWLRNTLISIFLFVFGSWRSGRIREVIYTEQGMVTRERSMSLRNWYTHDKHWIQVPSALFNYLRDKPKMQAQVLAATNTAALAMSQFGKQELKNAKTMAKELNQMAGQIHVFAHESGTCADAARLDAFIKREFVTVSAA